MRKVLVASPLLPGLATDVPHLPPHQSTGIPGLFSFLSAVEHLPMVPKILRPCPQRRIALGSLEERGAEAEVATLAPAAGR